MSMTGKLLGITLTVTFSLALIQCQNASCRNTQYMWKGICVDLCPKGYQADSTTQSCVQQNIIASSSGSGNSGAPKKRRIRSKAMAP